LQFFLFTIASRPVLAHSASYPMRDGGTFPVDKAAGA